MGGVESVILGLVQGLTEFLPVSSSGHLVLAQSLLTGFEEPGVLFDTLLHGGTLLAVLVYFRADVLRLLGALRPGGERSARRLMLLILVGTVPTGVIGVVFKDALEALFHRPRAAAAMLLVTGALLWIAETLARPRDRLDSMGPWRAAGIGVVQGLAIIPGISRSGSTISAAALMGIRAEDAARFSFLLSIPAICGAVVLQLRDVSSLTGQSLLPMGLGVLAAFGSGLWAIRFLMTAIRAGRFRWFAVYCWGLGGAYLLFGPGG